MDNINDVKAELDEMYKKYKKQKSTLNVMQTNEVVMLLKRLSQNGDTKYVAEQLVVFSAEVCGQYFDELTKGSVVPLNIVESIINSYISANTDTSIERFYVKKYATIAIEVINNYIDTSYNSKTIAKLVALVAYIGLKSDKNMTQFERVVLETKGRVYLVDYSSISERSLANVNKITVNLFAKGKLKTYTDLIEEWSIRYGFTSAAVNTTVSKEKTVKIEKVIVANETPADSGKSDGKQDIITTDKKDTLITAPNSETDASSSSYNAKKEKTKAPVVPEENTINNTAAVLSDRKILKPSFMSSLEKETPTERAEKKLYISIKRDMDKEQEAIITAFTNMITPVGKAFESIQGEINKSRELGIENTMLKAKNEELERQIAEMKTKLQENNQSFSSAKAENSDLRQQVRSLETKIAELDSKLNDAYSINSREASLEAEKVRSELKKAFSFLYEDWLEYEFSDVSEENYESLQAIMKKIFRSLERNGIDFKGSNE